jgi:GalNAc-alpha-(1->4)-GalNAc-alpha-(1->3)-diNAcBac-PP-undecaprenol alpha-1,4-N-acetyl-D-galactosaminyltransferase
MRIALVISGLGCGGIQRAAVTLAEEFVRRGHRTTMFTFGDADFFAPPAAVTLVSLGLNAARPTSPALLIPRTLKRLVILRRKVLASRPDVVLAHAPHVNVPTLIALLGSGVPVVVAEHGDVAPMHWRKALWYRLRRACYGRAFKVVSVSEAVDRNVAWLARERRAVIPNPIVTPPLESEDAVDARVLLAAQGDFIASMGRLSYAKGFDVLIQAFAQVAPAFPQWTLIIIGDGELRAALEQQVRALALEQRILFAGALAHPFGLLRRAQLFAMASRYEGFPLAHGEALACGLPVVATDCPSGTAHNRKDFGPGGVRELIRPEVDGVLTPSEDPAALARALADLMSDSVKRRLLAERATEVVARFAPDKILDAWDALLHEAERDGRRK